MKNARQQVMAIKAAILARASDVHFLRRSEGSEQFRAEIDGLLVIVTVDCSSKYEAITVDSVGSHHANGQLWVRKGVDDFNDKVSSKGYWVERDGETESDVEALFESLSDL